MVPVRPDNEFRYVHLLAPLVEQVFIGQLVALRGEPACGSEPCQQTWLPLRTGHDSIGGCQSRWSGRTAGSPKDK